MLWKKLQKPDNPAKREEMKDEIQREGGLEKHDVLAMVLSALLVLVPVSLAVLLLITFLASLPVWLG